MDLKGPWRGTLEAGAVTGSCVEEEDAPNYCQRLLHKVLPTSSLWAVRMSPGFLVPTSNNAGHIWKETTFVLAFNFSQNFELNQLKVLGVN